MGEVQRRKMILDISADLKIEPQIKKAEHLVELIKEANSLADELASKVAELKIDVKF